MQCVLTNGAITATVPGMDTVSQVRNAVRASSKRSLGMTAAEHQWLARITRQQWDNLPEHYLWLRDWEVV